MLEHHSKVDASRVYLPKQCREWYSNGVALRYWPEEKHISGWPVDEWLDAEADQTGADIESIIGRKLTNPSYIPLMTPTSCTSIGEDGSLFLRH